MYTARAEKLFRSLDREVWILTSRNDDDSSGLVTTSVAQASIVPELPRVTVGLAKSHFTTGLVERSKSFVLHLVAPDQVEWIWRFGTHTGRDVDKLSDLTTETRQTGAPILTDAIGWLECRCEAQLDTGDRWWILAEVVESKAPESTSILTFQQLLHIADDAQRTLLKQQLHADSLGDAQSILQWRAAR